MTNASMTFGRPGRLTFPRGSIWFGNAAAWLVNRLQRLDSWELKRRSDEPRTAAEVLAWASRIEKSDPGFAADLRAAVQRASEHEV